MNENMKKNINYTCLDNFGKCWKELSWQLFLSGDIFDNKKI